MKMLLITFTAIYFRIITKIKMDYSIKIKFHCIVVQIEEHGNKYFENVKIIIVQKYKTQNN